MRTTCAVVTGCMVVMMGTMAFAADKASGQAMPTKGHQIAQLGEDHSKEQLQSWLKTIKPAAGPTQKFNPAAAYWQQSVLRGGRGRMQE